MSVFVAPISAGLFGQQKSWFATMSKTIQLAMDLRDTFDSESDPETRLEKTVKVLNQHSQSQTGLFQQTALSQLSREGGL